MEWLETAVIVVHILVSLGLIGLVMIQQGKGAEAGASFGSGASQTVFGSQGSGSFLTKFTKYLAIIFFVTSISLAVIAKQKSEIAADEGLVSIPESVQEVDDFNTEAPQLEPNSSREELKFAPSDVAPELE